MLPTQKPKKQTPNYDHVLEEKLLRANVYEPEADSFLFLDALDSEMASIGALVETQINCVVEATPVSSSTASQQPVVAFRCVEVGPGSGIVITHLGMLMRAHLLEHRRAQSLSAAPPEGNTQVVVEFTAIDMNPLAVKAATETWRRNITVTDGAEEASSPDGGGTLVATWMPADGGATGLSIYFVARFEVGDLFEMDSEKEADAGRRKGSRVGGGFPTSPYYDVVLFNPPYVPTVGKELQDALDKKDLITAAWCGGPRGRVVVDRFFREIHSWWFPCRERNPHVTCLVVAIRQNEPADMARYFKDQFFTAAAERGSSILLGADGAVPEFEGDESVDASPANGIMGCTRAAPPLPPLKATSLSMSFTVKTAAARYTGEHLSILKFDATLS